MEKSTAVDLTAIASQMRQNIERVIVGKSNVVELVTVAILSDGHILLEDVPGIGKTMLAKSLARSLGCSFHRLQCTPDLLPSDVTGTYIFNQRTSDFEFRAGPVFAQLLLVDEINRATPRTQSALLEAMEERQVTLEGETRALPTPFIVIATQNPIELEGTFPLPEAQLDRFLLRLQMGYPAVRDDRVILERFALHNPMDNLTAVASADEVLSLQKLCKKVRVDSSVLDYLIQLIHATRQHEQVELGASPRAMQGLFRSAQALAAIRGRSYVMPDDVKYLAPFVLAHRIILKSQGNLRGISSRTVVERILASVAVPVEDNS